MLGVFAEFETNLRCERQLEGIAKAKAADKYRRHQIGELGREGLGATEMARRSA
jgi:DNA invertase Pin-like site-specific DNA recombinase